MTGTRPSFLIDSGGYRRQILSRPFRSKKSRNVNLRHKRFYDTGQKCHLYHSCHHYQRNRLDRLTLNHDRILPTGTSRFDASSRSSNSDNRHLFTVESTPRTTARSTEKLPEESDKHNQYPPPEEQRQITSSSTALSIFSKDAATQPIDTPTAYRWYAVPPANLVHLSIGGVYVYSMWTPALTQIVGVIAPTVTDWTVSQTLPVFSAAAISLGLTTHYLGEWVERVGPRYAGAIGSICWGTGLLTTAAGVYTHQLPLVYLGYSVIGGIGWGLMYLCPVTSVMKWFPDRRGLATGIALSAFGMGAAIAPAIIHTLLDWFAIAPDFIGQLESTARGMITDTISTATISSTTIPDAQPPQPQQFVELTTLTDGSQIVSDTSPVGIPGQPVVVATESDVAKLPLIGIMGPGAYALDTGDTGAAKALASLGIIYGGIGLLGSRFMMLPHPEWKPVTMDPMKEKEITKDNSQPYPIINSNEKIQTEEEPVTVMSSNNNNVGLPAPYVVSSTTQFPLLWLSVFGNATGGLALLSSSKLMVTDIWSGIAPSIVTASFATGYVSTLGLGMAAGRFGWSFLSDYIGRQNTYAIFGLGIPIVGLSPYLTHEAAAMGSSSIGSSIELSTTSLDLMSSSPDQAVLPLLAAFYGGSVLAITFYGGIFSTLPAYIADLFGQKHAGAIHGKLLTAWAASAVVGPMGLAYLRSDAIDRAIHDLLSKIEDDGAFVQNFGCSMEDADKIESLIESKTITIGRLLDILPESTVNPTPFIYDTTCYAAACLMGVSFISNLAIRPLNYVEISSKLEKEEAATSSSR